jgi:mono/diheme cytochrome c family protein
MRASCVLKGVLIAALIVGWNIQVGAQQSAPQQDDIGKMEYQASCASCHGIDAKGTGPVAASLNKKPADLTRLAKRNDGVFPFERTYETIDGRIEIKSHGTREMPVFGYVLWPLYEPETVMRTRILAIIDYLYRIQEK